MADDNLALVRDVQSRFEDDSVLKGVYPDTYNQSEMRQKVDKRVYEFGGYTRIPVIGDGNCFFRSCSQSLFGHQNFHPDIRRATVALMRSDKNLYCYDPDLDEMEYYQYLSRVDQLGTSVGPDVSQAAADLLRARIIRTRSNSSKIITEMVPHDGKVFYEINLAKIPYHVDALGRRHLYQYHLEE